MLTVVHLNIIGKASGSQNVSLELANNIPNFKHIFVFSPEFDALFLAEIEQQGFEVKINPHLSRSINPISDIRSLVWLVKLHSTIDFQILHSHSSKAGVLSRAFKCLRRSVTVINHVHGLPFVISGSKVLNLIYFVIEVVSSWKADRIILVNQLYKSYWPYRKGETLYNFTTINKSIFKYSVARGKELKVGFVGRFDKQKNPERFIRIAYVLRQENLKFYMWGESVVGGITPANDEAVEVNCWVTPSEEGVIDIDVLLILSRWESFSMVAFEAAKRQILVVGIPVDGFSEIIRTIGLPIEIDSDSAVADVLLWLSNLDDIDLHRLKLGCSIRTALLAELNDLDIQDLYELRAPL